MPSQQAKEAIPAAGLSHSPPRPHSVAFSIHPERGLVQGPGSSWQNLLSRELTVCLGASPRPNQPDYRTETCSRKREGCAAMCSGRQQPGRPSRQLLPADCCTKEGNVCKHEEMCMESLVPTPLDQAHPAPATASTWAVSQQVEISLPALCLWTHTIKQFIISPSS